MNASSSRELFNARLRGERSLASFLGTDVASHSVRFLFLYKYRTLLHFVIFSFADLFTRETVTFAYALLRQLLPVPLYLH